MDFNEYYSAEQESAINFVEEKYGIDIEVYRYEMGAFVSKADVIRGYVDGMDRDTEFLQIRIEVVDGGRVYKDNYFNFIARPMIEEWFEKFISQYFKEYKIYQGNKLVYHPNELSYGSTMEDLFECNPNYRLEAFVFVKEDGSSIEEYEERVMQIKKSIMESGKLTRLILYVVNEEIYDRMERYGVVDFKRKINFSEKPDNINFYYYYNELIKIEEGER